MVSKSKPCSFPAEHRRACLPEGTGICPCEIISDRSDFPHFVSYMTLTCLGESHFENLENTLMTFIHTHKKSFIIFVCLHLERFLLSEKLLCLEQLVLDQRWKCQLCRRVWSESQESVHWLPESTAFTVSTQGDNRAHQNVSPWSSRNQTVILYSFGTKSSGVQLARKGTSLVFSMWPSAAGGWFS